MNSAQQAAIQGALQGALQGAESAAVVGLGVASVVDPRVGAAIQASTALLSAASDLNQISKAALSDKQLLLLWAQNGASMANLHDEIFGADAAVDTDPNVVANKATAAAIAQAPVEAQPAVPAPAAPVEVLPPPAPAAA